MKVFLSWHGTRSLETAEFLKTWISQILQAAETWISYDIEKGTRWNEKISKELEDTKFGIICLNKDNLSSEWIHFEAGALSKTSDSYVCTFLLDLTPNDIKPPLSQFQHTLFTKDDIRKLLNLIRNKIVESEEKTIAEKDLDEIFESNWIKAEKKLTGIQNKVSTEMTDREILDEVLRQSTKSLLFIQEYLPEIKELRKGK